MNEVTFGDVQKLPSPQKEKSEIIVSQLEGNCVQSSDLVYYEIRKAPKRELMH